MGICRRNLGENKKKIVELKKSGTLSSFSGGRAGMYVGLDVAIFVGRFYIST